MGETCAKDFGLKCSKCGKHLGHIVFPVDVGYTDTDDISISQIDYRKCVVYIFCDDCNTEQPTIEDSDDTHCISW